MVRIAPLLSKKTKEDSVLSKPRRILGFNPAIGRGFVTSADQYPNPEFLFLDTPSHPNLQMVCSRIIDQQGQNIVAAANSKERDQDRPNSVADVSCEGLTFRFIIRFVSPQTNPELLRMLKKVYLEEDDDNDDDDGKHGQNRAAKYGMIVMIPAMQGTKLESLWGSSSARRGGVCGDLKTETLDKWIESMAHDDSIPC